MKRTNRTVALTVSFLMLAGVLSCSKIMPERYIDYNAGRVPVNLPRGLRNAEKDWQIDKPTAVIISLPTNDQIFAGKERTPSAKEDLRFKLRQLLQDQTDPDRMVYLAASFLNDWGNLVEICHAIRMQDVSRVGLLATNEGMNTPGRISVELPVEPDPNKDISTLRPNALTLVVSINPDLTVRLNQEDMGNVNDSLPLSVMVQNIFKSRREQHAYKPGFETRTDLPEEERVEMTITVKSPRSLKYGDVMKIIDALRGAGARPIVLQLDDLPN